MTQLDYSKYAKPDDVLNSANLNQEQKIEILEKWAVDEKALQRAAAEGLNGGESHNLQAVQNALTRAKELTHPSALKQSLQDANLEPATQQLDGIFGTKPS